jgi:hypothetical protein
MELIVEWVGQSAAAVPHFSDSLEVELGATHSVFGNRVRFQSGTVPICLDAEWRQKMSARDRAVGTALASPLLSCYGYPMRIGKGSPQTN